MSLELLVLLAFQSWLYPPAPPPPPHPPPVQIRLHECNKCQQHLKNTPLFDLPLRYTINIDLMSGGELFNKLSYSNLANEII